MTRRLGPLLVVAMVGACATPRPPWEQPPTRTAEMGQVFPIKYIALTAGPPPSDCALVCGAQLGAALVECTGLAGDAPTPDPVTTIGCHRGDRHAYIPVDEARRDAQLRDLSSCLSVCEGSGEGRRACGMQEEVPTRWGALVTCRYEPE